MVLLTPVLTIGLQSVLRGDDGSLFGLLWVFPEAYIIYFMPVQVSGKKALVPLLELIV